MFPAEVRALYPTVDWSQVDLARGLPWYARPGTRAMVVPRPLSRRGVRVHVREDVALGSPEGCALLAHEAFHVLQYQTHAWGFGVVRPFVLAYLLLGVRYGFGRAHPMEAPAYAAARAPRRMVASGFRLRDALRALVARRRR